MKKMIAPIIITIVLLLLYLAYFAGIIVLGLPIWVSIIAGVIVLGISGIVIYVLIERIKEIRSGEEDDLSKY